MELLLYPLITISRDNSEALVKQLSLNNIDSYIVESTIANTNNIVTIAVNPSKIEDAIQVIENSLTCSKGIINGEHLNKSIILIPIDLSPKSELAVNVGFKLAVRLNATPLILHTYEAANLETSIPIVDAVASQTIGAENESNENIHRLLFNKFLDNIKLLQKRGELLDIDFKSELTMGLPEEVIDEYSRTLNPLLIVMSTRDKHKRAQDLVGSVTAEVLDGCRTPLFTVTEGHNFPEITDIINLVMFCNLDKKDILSTERFLGIFNYPKVNITLIPVSDKFGKNTKNKINDLCNILQKMYPSINFATEVLPQKSFRKDFPDYILKNNIQLIIVQNKKKNIFSRLVNPGIAHILFYERDIPMVVLPLS